MCLLNPCALVQEAGRVLRCALCVVCLLLCGGPALIIAGIVTLSAPNTRARDIAEYNMAVEQYNASAPAAWSGMIGGVTVQQRSGPVAVDGNTEDVNSATSQYVTATLGRVGERATIEVDVRNIATFSRTLELMRTVQRSIDCTLSACTSNCNSESSFTCSVQRMNQRCQSVYGSDAEYTGGAPCRSNDFCTCNVPVYLRRYCEQIDTQVTPNIGTGLPCNFPFSLPDGADYVLQAQQSYTVELRGADDPYIALERLTDGSRDFGITRGQQVGLGIGLIVGGAALILVIALVGYCIARCVIGRRKDSESGNAEMGNAQAAPGYGQPAPAYGQPAPAYGQPAPGYGQPAPAYGQPAPAYGQPAPGYGQPAPGYGQPAPAYGQPQPALYGEAQPAGYGQPWGGPPDPSGGTGGSYPTPLGYPAKV